MVAPLGVPMGAAIHAVNPARVRVVVDAVEAAWVRALGTVKATVKMAVAVVADVEGLREYWTVFNLLEQT